MPKFPEVLNLDQYCNTEGKSDFVWIKKDKLEEMEEELSRLREIEYDLHLEKLYK